MRCYDCAEEAVALCPGCQVGQCEEHLARGLTWYRRQPVITCIHRAGEATDPSRAPARSGKS